MTLIIRAIGPHFSRKAHPLTHRREAMAAECLAISRPITWRTRVWANGQPVTRKKEMSNAE